MSRRREPARHCVDVVRARTHVRHVRRRQDRDVEEALSDLFVFADYDARRGRLRLRVHNRGTIDATDAVVSYAPGGQADEDRYELPRVRRDQTITFQAWPCMSETDAGSYFPIWYQINWQDDRGPQLLADQYIDSLRRS